MDMAAGGTLAASPASAEADSDPAESHEAIVVGAGSAGLAAAVALGERSFETLVIECADAVGARWRSRYDELRLNSWRPMSKLQGRGMPRRYGATRIVTTSSNTSRDSLRITGCQFVSKRGCSPSNLMRSRGDCRPPPDPCTAAIL